MELENLMVMDSYWNDDPEWRTECDCSEDPFMGIDCWKDLEDDI